MEASGMGPAGATSVDHHGYVNAGTMGMTGKRTFYLYRSDAPDHARVNTVEAHNASEAMHALLDPWLTGSLPVPWEIGERARDARVCVAGEKRFIVGEVHWPAPSRRSHGEVRSAFSQGAWSKVERIWAELSAFVSDEPGEASGLTDAPELVADVVPDGDGLALVC